MISIGYQPHADDSICRGRCRNPTRRPRATTADLGDCLPSALSEGPWASFSCRVAAIRSCRGECSLPRRAFSRRVDDWEDAANRPLADQNWLTPNV